MFVDIYDCRALFLFNDPATTAIYTLSLHDALPICARARGRRFSRTDRLRGHARHRPRAAASVPRTDGPPAAPDRKSTRLNSSHEWISYAVFCLKKKKEKSRHSDSKEKQASSALQQF